MSEWISCKLGGIADVQTGPFGSQLHREDYKLVGTPIITVEHLGDNRITYQNLPLVSDEDKERLSKYLLIEGDIVFSRVGSVDRRAYVSKNENGWLFSGRLLRVRANQEVMNPKFLSYYFGDESFKEYIRRIAVGATMPSINTTILSEVGITYPPLPEQKAIASVLSSLDDKIDLLHRQNKTLEAIAETLFRQWFIEEAQEDWDEGTVQDYCIHYKEGIKPQDFPTKTFSHYSIPSFDQNMNPVSESGSEIRSNKYSVVPYCLLFSKLNPNKDKRIWLILDQPGENPICSTEFQVVLPKEQKHLYFIYGWLSIPQNYNEIASSVGGTSGSHQRIDPADIFNFPCPRMDETYLDQFNAKVEPLFRNIQKNHIQIRTLEKLRDTLLPKLMSGEVRITL